MEEIKRLIQGNEKLVLSKEALDLLVFYNDVTSRVLSIRAVSCSKGTAVPRALAYFLKTTRCAFN